MMHIKRFNRFFIHLVLQLYYLTKMFVVYCNLTFETVCKAKRTICKGNEPGCEVYDHPRAYKD